MGENAVIVGAFVVFAALLSMADYKQVRARLRERFVPMSLFFGGLALATILIRVTWPKPPSVASINGTYENACCSPIFLRDGLLIAGDQRIPLQLRIEKWGNEAELATGIRVQNGRIVSSSAPGSNAILFNENWKAFTLCEGHCGPSHEFEFTRA